MSSLRPRDRKSLCRFTFADGRQCRTPHAIRHPYSCTDLVVAGVQTGQTGERASIA